MILNDKQIIERVEKENMIENFIDHQVREVEIQCIHEHVDGIKNTFPVKKKVVSYGLSSFGYDMRIGTKFKIFTNIRNGVVDPKNFDDSVFVDVEVKPHEAIVIPPNSFALGLSVEKFNIPEDIVTVCVGKSTYARCGIILNVTPFEPRWRGYPTLEISNTTPCPCKVYAAEGIGQVLFFKGEPCKTTYEDRKGKYQDQGNKIYTAKV